MPSGSPRCDTRTSGLGEDCTDTWPCPGVVALVQ